MTALRQGADRVEVTVPHYLTMPETVDLLFSNTPHAPRKHDRVAFDLRRLVICPDVVWGAVTVSVNDLAATLLISPFPIPAGGPSQIALFPEEQ